MFLKILCIIPLILSSCLTTINISNNTQSISTFSYPYEDIYDVSEYKLLTEISNEHIYLYAIDWKEAEIKQSGVYRELLLDLKGKKHYFPWTVVTNESFKPQLILSDINNNGKQDLIVITTADEGTGILMQDVHIFEVDTFNDIKYMDPLESIYQNVKTEMKSENGIVNIKIDVNGNVFTTKAKESSAGLWFNEVAFGSRINYEIVNNKLIAKVSAQVSPGLFVGEITIDYVFRNNRLEPNKIIFTPTNYTNVFF